MNGHFLFAPTHDSFGDGGLLAAPASAGFSGGRFSGLPLPFRPSAPPAALPALYSNPPNNHTHAHAAHSHQHQLSLSSTSAAFAHPSPLRMATFAQDEAELAHLQELSNKWESDATVSSLLPTNDTSAQTT
jgi:hypothetical protein